MKRTGTASPRIAALAGLLGAGLPAWAQEAAGRAADASLASAGGTPGFWDIVSIP